MQNNFSTTGIILAAGRGVRLLPHTEELPKCLLEVAGKPILHHQIQALLDAGVYTIYIGVGFAHEKIRSYVIDNFPNNAIHCIQNDLYVQKNNFYTLALIANEIPSPYRVLQINGDVMFDPSIIKSVLLLDPVLSYSVIRMCVCGDEEMKICRRADGTIQEMNKKISSSESPGEAIGIHLFSKKFWDSMRTVLSERDVHDQDYFERAIEITAQERSLEMYDIGELPIIEVDFEDDLLRAQKLFA